MFQKSLPLSLRPFWIRIQTLIQTIDRSVSVEEYIDIYIVKTCSLHTCDSIWQTQQTNKGWREEVQKEILGGENLVQGGLQNSEEQVDNEDEITEVLMARNHALQAAEDLIKFALFHAGDDKLVNYVSPAVEHLYCTFILCVKQSVNKVYNSVQFDN